MKVIEYILAFIVLMSFIPLFNIAIHSYYVVKPVTPTTYVKDIVMDIAEKTIKQMYLNGNLTPEIIDLDSVIADSIDPYTTENYAYRLEIFSNIREIDIDTSNNRIIVKALDNRKLNLLIIYNDLTHEYITQQASMYRDDLYWYIVSGESLTKNVDNIDVIIAVLESRASKYIGYWFKSQNNIGYALNIMGRKSLMPCLFLIIVQQIPIESMITNI